MRIMKMSEWNNINNNCQKRRDLIFLLFLFWCIHRASNTEVRVNTWYGDRILDLDVSIPVTMECHSMPPGYQEVLWYKDDALVVKNGRTEKNAVLLPLTHIMCNASYSVNFGNVLKLQGYYWCETDNMEGTEATKYLFRIPGIHTFAGKFVATRDNLKNNRDLSLEDELALKRAAYENDIQKIMFGFLPTPNAYVTNITVLATGMEVRFYLYVGQRNRWRPMWSDQLTLEQVLDGLPNEDARHNGGMEDWVQRRGIEQITLRSTLGCYEYTYMVPADIPQDIASGTDVISRKECSTKNDSSVTPVCSGDIYTGYRWIDPSGRCNILQSKFNFGGEPRPIYRRRLQTFTETSDMPTVRDLKILTELTETYDLNEMEMEAALSVIDHLFTIDRRKLEAAKSNYKLTSRLLRIIDNIVRKASQWDSDVVIAKDHLVLSVIRTKGEKGKDLVLEASTVTCILPSDVQTGPQFHSHSSRAVFFTDWLLFSNPKNVLARKNYNVLPSPAVYVVFDEEIGWNSIHPRRIYFRNQYGDRIKNPVCVHYDTKMKDGEGEWSTEGCEYGGIINESFSCICQGHSIFSIVLSERPDHRIPDFTPPDVMIPKLRMTDSETVKERSFNGLNLVWIIPVGILMLVARTLIIRWCRSLWSIERRARRHDVALVM